MTTALDLSTDLRSGTAHHSPPPSYTHDESMDTPIEPPPPAYEAEHDYDRKISDALERSLAISNQTQQQSSLSPGRDEWEEWDEARFEAAALARARERQQDNEQPRSDEQPSPPTSRNPSEKERLASQHAWQPDHRSGEASSSTSSGSVGQPSRRLPACPPTKERPSWYSDTELDASAGSGSSQNNLVSSPHLVHHLPPEENLPNEPLPPFTAVGPSLEGPPFEEVVRLPPRLLPASNIDSPPQSPLDSVESDTLPDPPESSNRRGYGESYHLTSPRQLVASSMPPTVSVPPSSHPLPMRFDSSMAYAKHNNVNVSSSEEEPVDASAFYKYVHSSFRFLLTLVMGLKFCSFFPLYLIPDFQEFQYVC